MQDIYCPNLTEDNVVWILFLLHKRELYCAYAFIISWEVVYLNKKNLSTDTMLKFFPFNAPIVILTALELVT